MAFPATPGSAWPGQVTPGNPGSPPGGGGGAAVVNHWPATEVSKPGLLLAGIDNQDGNTLVAFIGWNDATFPQIGNVSVADDAHNYWQPLVANAQSTFGVRGAIWIATKADPATVVSISTSLPPSSIAALIVEYSGMPALVQIDGTPGTSGSPNASSASAGYTAGTYDYAFGLAVTGNNGDSMPTPGSPWSALPVVFVNDPGGAGGAADVRITPVWQAANPGSISVSYSPSGSLPIAALCAGITQASPVVTNPHNPNWPVFQVQAAFGAQVGNGQTPWTWTDISAYAIKDDGNILDVTRGRAYELTGPQSGTIQLWLNNTTGAFSPANPGSPFAGSILPQTPIRVIATWNNEVYPVAFGYVDKWPQTFDMPQWAMTNVSASDGMGVLANLTLYSALQAEILADQPYSYWPLSESYGEANGLPFENLGSALSNTKPMVGLDGQPTGSTPLSTGQTINLQGDTGTGIGLSGLTANAELWSSGAVCVDPDLPAFGTSPIAIETWVNLPTSPPTAGSFVTPLVSLLGAPTNFGSGGGPVRFQIAAKSVTSTNYAMQITIADFSHNSYTFSGFTCANDGNTHQHVFIASYAGSTWTISHYQDGVFDTSTTNNTVGASSDLYQVVLGPALITPLIPNPYNYTVAHVAIWGSSLNPQRILAHYNAGANGFINDNGTTRFSRVMAWSQSNMPMAATQPSASPLMGAAFSIEGQAGTDALNDLITTEGGWPYADASGNNWWASRSSFYNKSPKWVLSDNPADGGFFYDPSQGFDFDNSYLWAVAQGTREIGQGSQVTTSPTQGVSSLVYQDTGAIVRVANASAQASYGNRNSLQQTVLSASDQDVNDRVFWSLAKYSASSLRIPQIMISAADNPSLWPVVLGIEQGDIVKVKRSPLSGTPYTVLGIVVQVHLEIGVNKGQVTLGVVPYNIEGGVLQADKAPYNTLANGIGW